MTTMNTSVQGASRIGKDAFAAEGAQPGEIAQRLGADRAPLSASPRLAASTGSDSRRSSQAPIRPAPGAGSSRAGRTPAGQTGEHGQRDQGLDVAARQHAVEHLEHVERRDQDQEIEEQAERGDHPKAAPRFAQGRIQGGRLRCPRGAARLVAALGRDRTGSLLEEAPDLAARRLALPHIAPINRP